MNETSPLLPVLASLLASAGAACGGAVETSRPEGPNLLLVAVDTLRADHLGAYGYERPTSPEIDRFFESAVVFDEAHAASSWTLPSFATFLTSQHSSTHGCWQFTSSLDPSFTTLAEVLADAGWTTAAVVSHVFFDREYGLDQGFEAYDDSLVLDHLRKSHLAISSAGVTDRGLAFLERRANDTSGAPWVLFAHYFDPHKAYQVHEGVTEAFGDDNVAKYDGEIAFTDRHVGRLLVGLDRLGLARDTVVAFVADHGEEFRDHGGELHGVTLFAEVGRIPLAIRAPGIAPRRVGEVVGGVDLMPTLLELLGVPATVPMAGRSVVDLMRGVARDERDEHGALMELRLDQGIPDSILEAFVLGRWKLIVDTPRREREGEPATFSLYDRVADPTEQRDVAGEHPAVVEDLTRRLREAVARAERAASRFDASGPRTLSAEELERLRELGYLGEDD